MQHEKKFEELRKKATKFLEEKSQNKQKKQWADIENLLEELNIYHLELEMQNEELEKSRLETENIREKYQGLFDSAPIGYCTLTRTSNIKEINRSATNMLKVAKSSILNLSFITFIEKKYRRIFYNFLNNIFETDFPKNCELVLINTQKELINVQLSGSRYYDNQHQQELCRTAITDISIQKKTEKKLATSEHNFRILAENSSDAISRHSRRGKFLYASPAMKKILGYTQKELKKKKVLSLIHGEDYQQIRNQLLLLQNHKDEIRIEFRAKTKSGKYIWIQSTCQLMKKQNQFETIAVSRDITKQKEIEENLKQYERIIFSSNEEISFIDTNYIYQVTNQAYRQAFNKNQEEIIGKSVKEILGEKEFKAIKPKLEACLNGKEIHYQGWVERANKGFRHRDVSYYPYYNLKNEIDGIVIFSRDTTDYKQIQALKQESEIKFKAVFEGSPNAIFLINPENYEIIDVNQTAGNLLKYSKEELIGQAYTKLHDPASVSGPEKKLAHLIELNKKSHSNTTETRLIDSNNKIIPVEMGAEIININQKSVIQVVFQDISQQLQSKKIIQQQYQQLQEQNINLNNNEQKLKLQNKFQNTLMDTIPNPLFYKDKQGKFIGCNSSFEKMLGLKKENIIGKTTAEIFSNEQSEFFTEKDQELYQQKNIQVYEKEITFPSRKKRNIQLNKSLFYDTNGKIAGIIGILIDITKHRKNEAKIKWELQVSNALTDLSSSIINTSIPLTEIAIKTAEKAQQITQSRLGFVATIDPKTKNLLLETFNPELAEKYNLKTRAKKIVFPVNQDGSYNGLWGHCLNTKEGFFTNNPQTHPSSKGVPRWHDKIENFLSVPSILGDQVVGQISIANNTIGYNTQHLNAIKRMAELFALTIGRHRMESALKLSKEKAEAANLSKSHFLANMSHEIRTPLNAILGFSEILKKQLQHHPDYQQYLAGISSSGNNLLNLINDILDLSKIEAGKLEINTETVDIYQLVEETKQIFDTKAEEKALTVEYDIESNIPRYIISDPVRLRQILFNLVGNAVKFTDTGYVKIEMRRKNSNKKSNTIDLQLKVIDTGIGIDAKKLSYIFQPFRQQIEQSTKKYGGTGLGLSITKRLVEMLNGNIHVESQLNKGSTFTVNLSNIKISQQNKLKHEKETELSSDKIHFTNAKILFIAENKQLIENIFEILKQENLQLIKCLNTDEGLKTAQKEQPELIVIEISAFFPNKLRLIENFKLNLQNIPLIGVYKEVNSKISKMLNACDAQIQQPVKTNHLFKTISRFIPYEKEIDKNNKKQAFDYLTQLIIDEINKNHDKKNIINRLYTEIFDQCQKAKVTLNIPTIQRISNYISSFAKEKELVNLHKFGDELTKNIKSFNFDKIIKSLAQFIEIVKTLKNDND